MPGFDYLETLPQTGSWTIEAICRSSSDGELAFLYDENADQFGIVGFHLVDGTLKRGRIIVISEHYAENCDIALEAFANGEFADDSDDKVDDDENDAASLDYDDGILADEEQQRHEAAARRFSLPINATRVED